VKGINPKTREIAKDLARRSGMTLGEWLTHVIAEDGGEAPAPTASARKTADRPASENRTPRRGEDSGRGDDSGRGNDMDRVLETLQDLSARFEASAQEQADSSARFEHAIAELKADQAKVAQRLQTAELGGANDGKLETLRALEGALNKVAGHMAAGEGRQREAMATMRQELGEEMSRVADQVNRKVLEVENRGADAIAQVGAEVTRVANAVEQRLRRADDAQAEALEKLGGEIARITERLSERISAAERRAQGSVEEVGGQVARLADRIHARQERNESELVERMRQSEERTAKLLEEARQTIDRRLLRAGVSAPEEPPAASAFTERWTPVETPDAEAAEADVIEVEAAVETPAQAAADISAEDFAETAFLESPAVTVEAEAIEEEGADAESILEASYDGLTTDEEEEPYADLDDEDADEDDEPGTIGFEAYTPTLTADAAFTAGDDLVAMQAVADAISSDEEDEDEDSGEDDHLDGPEVFSRGGAFAPYSDHEEREESLRPSPRDMIAEAKAAAFAEQPSFQPVHAERDFEEHRSDSRRFDDRTDSGVTFINLDARRPRQQHSMRGALLAGGVAAAMGLAGVGYVALNPEIMHGLGVPAPKPIPVGPASTPAAQTPAPSPAQAAVALATAPTPKSDTQDLDAMYRDALAKVDANDASGVAPLRTAANLGYAPAQRRLGKLFEDGGAGVVKDAAEGRRWTQRAAANGDARAMHNLALDYYEGSGGPKNLAIAAQWFQRAAELGLRDSQYNLARFMEAGIGTPQDLQGAYRWYLIAARAGDTEAQSRAEALKPKLPADQQTKAQTLAGAFQPDPASAPASLTALLKGSNPKQLALAQRALGKLGYYKGADDGAPSQALGEAIQGYQRERGLAANGQLNPALLQTFASIAP
jgi:localization factor PodJL